MPTPASANLYDLFAPKFEAAATTVAFRTEQGALTYGDLAALVARTANALSSLGDVVVTRIAHMSATAPSDITYSITFASDVNPNALSSWFPTQDGKLPLLTLAAQTPRLYDGTLGTAPGVVAFRARQV
jgi:hypothetical protein